jgi:hypothetical protein
MRAARNIFLSICFIVPVSAAFGRDGARKVALGTGSGIEKSGAALKSVGK